MADFPETHSGALGVGNPGGERFPPPPAGATPEEAQMKDHLFTQGHTSVFERGDGTFWALNQSTHQWVPLPDDYKHGDPLPKEATEANGTAGNGAGAIQDM